MSDKTLVIAGLGNPGRQYEVTRHNMGFLVAKALARQLGWSFKEDKHFEAFVSKGTVDGVTLHLLLPTTYMNLSGNAVRRYLEYYKLTPENLVVVADDVALSFGEIRLKTQGSAGGHNGLKSVEEQLGTTQYARLRMGIGDHRQNEQPVTLADYVLGDFTQNEVTQLEDFIERGTKVLMRLLKDTFAKVMNEVNMKQTKNLEANPQKNGAGDKA